MTAKEAKEKAATAYLDTVKRKINEAVIRGLMSCRVPQHYLTPEVAAYLTGGGYKYEKHTNRGGWFTEYELIIDWS